MTFPLFRGSLSSTKILPINIPPPPLPPHPSVHLKVSVFLLFASCYGPIITVCMALCHVWSEKKGVQANKTEGTPFPFFIVKILQTQTDLYRSMYYTWSGNIFHFSTLRRLRGRVSPFIEALDPAPSSGSWWIFNYKTLGIQLLIKLVHSFKKNFIYLQYTQ